MKRKLIRILIRGAVLKMFLLQGGSCHLTLWDSKAPGDVDPFNTDLYKKQVAGSSQKLSRRTLADWINAYIMSHSDSPYL